MKNNLIFITIAMLGMYGFIGALIYQDTRINNAYDDTVSVRESA